MRVLILGAGGILGQSMRECVPSSVTVTFTRLGVSPGYYSIDLTDSEALESLITQTRPDVVVNLAGESNTDTVERNPGAYLPINVHVPYTLARLSDRLGYRLIHISSQAVFGGTLAPYGLKAALDPINAYGRQKADAETALQWFRGVTIIRPTFVLGVRPDPSIGRTNPIEQMLSGQRKQVRDRWFSVSFAPDVATCIWDAVLQKPDRPVIQAGVPVRVSRYQIMCDMGLGLNVEPVSHDDFPGIAPRPRDTTYACGEHIMEYHQGLLDCVKRWHERQAVAA
jgi:dTDP-4-dehydrorhamnose reductase